MILPLDIHSALHVACNMRAVDSEEVWATSPHNDPVQWVNTLMNLPGESVCVTAPDAEPVMMGGVFVTWPGVAMTWMVATDRLPEVGALVHKAALELHRRWQDKGIRRFQAMSMQAHKAPRTWLHQLGYRVEGTHPKYGRDGQTFFTMAKVVG